MQKLINFYQDKEIDILKLGYTLPNLANICPHKPTDTNIYLFKEGKIDLLEQFRAAVGVFQSFLGAQQFLRKFSFESLKKYANQVWGLMMNN